MKHSGNETTTKGESTSRENEKEGYERDVEEELTNDKEKDFQSDDEDDIYRNQRLEVDDNMYTVFEYLSDPCHPLKWQELAKEVGFSEPQIKQFQEYHRSERKQRMEFLKAYERCNRGHPLMARDLVSGLNKIGHSKLAGILKTQTIYTLALSAHKNELFHIAPSFRI